MIELLTVIAIIAVLSTILLSIGRWTSESGEIARARADLACISAALETYRRTLGDYPQTGAPEVLVQSLLGRCGPTGVALNVRRFVETAHLVTVGGRDPETDTNASWCDPWGQPYCYAYKTSAPWQASGFVLYSNGPDGAATDLLTGGRIDFAAVENRDNVQLNP